MDKIYIAEFDAENKLFMKKLNDAEKRTTETVSRVSQITKNLGATMLAGFGAHQIISFLDNSIKAYNEQERAVTKLNVALGRNTKGLQDYATGLMKVTTFGDEQIIDAMALIGIYVKDEEQIKKLTKATLDLAVAKGIDLSTAANLVAKSVGTSTNALSRQGVIIKGNVGTTERYESAIKSLSGLFSGQAEADAKTYAGQLKQIDNQMNELEESIGEKIAPTWTLFLKNLLTGLDNTLIRIQQINQAWDDANAWVENVLGISSDETSLSKTTDKLKSDRKELEDLITQSNQKSTETVKIEKNITNEVDKRKKLLESMQSMGSGGTAGGALDPRFAMNEERKRDNEKDKWRYDRADKSKIREIKIAEQAMDRAVMSTEMMVNNFGFMIGDAQNIANILGIGADTFIAKLLDGLSRAASLASSIFSIINIIGSFTPAGMAAMALSEGGFVSTSGSGAKVSKIPKFAGGGMMKVPSGYSNDSYPMLVSSGESVHVYSSSATRSMENILADLLAATKAQTLTIMRNEPKVTVINKAANVRTSVIKNEVIKNRMIKEGETFAKR